MDVSPCEIASPTTNWKRFSRSLYVGGGTVTRNWALSRSTPEIHFSYAKQIQQQRHITCGFAGCVPYYDTTFNVLWERRDVFKNLRVYPDCMTILSLQHNPMLPYYGVRV